MLVQNPQKTTKSSLSIGKSPYLPTEPSSSDDVKMRLFCFPYAGAGASAYRNWVQALPKSIEVCPVQLPGREERISEKPYIALSLLIVELGKVLSPYLDRPFSFFGHSMGALICFELARLLRRSGSLLPSNIFISGRPAPQLPLMKPPTFNLPDRDFIDELRQIQGTPDSVLQNRELMELLLPLLRADFEICQTYEYVHEPPLDCPFFVFGGLADNDIDQESLLAWRAQTTCPMQMQLFAGDHFFVLNNEQAILQIVSQQLNQSIS
jgi:medium-chain acyl-[acyl-carrier-protein] hydrolase